MSLFVLVPLSILTLYSPAIFIIYKIPKNVFVTSKLELALFVIVIWSVILYLIGFAYEFVYWNFIAEI